MDTMDIFLCVKFFSMFWAIAAANGGYLLTAPSTFRSGVDQVISVTILKPSRPIHVNVKLLSKDGELISSAGHAIFGKGSLKLKIPMGVKGRGTLKVCGNCISPKPNTYSFANSTVVTIHERGSVVFIQMDKPIYKPEQRVYMNIITAGPNLMPLDEDIFAYVVDPHGSRMMEWNSLPKLCCGVVNTSFPLSDQPVLGTWTVFVKVQGHLYNKTFSVQKYVKPKFEVYIVPPPFIRDWDVCETVEVHAKYLYGKGVSGNLTAVVYLQGVGYYRDYRSQMVKTKTKIENGFALLNVCVSDLMKIPLNEHFRGLLYVEAEVKTPDGSTFKAIDSSCPVNKQLVDVSFSPDTRQHFKPGVPYPGKVLVTYPDGSLAHNVTITIRSEVDGENNAMQEFTSETGEVSFVVQALPIQSKTMWLHAKVLRIEDKDMSSHFFSSYMSTTNWYSPSKCHILLENKGGKLKAGSYAKIKVQSTCRCDFTFYHEVVSRGNIAHSGVHYAGLHGSRYRRNVHFETGDRDVNQTTHIPKTCTMFFTVPISRQMAPSSKLLVYYVRRNGEGVADTLKFDVEHSYENQITLDFAAKHLAPKNKVKLKMKTKPDSCVCVASVDKSLHLLRPGFALSSEQIFGAMSDFDNSLDESNENEYWKHRMRRSHNPWSSYASSIDAKFAFEDSGLLVMTDVVQLDHRQDLDFYKGPIQQRPVQRYMSYASLTAAQQDVKRIRKKERTFFPDTWIWQCFNVSSTEKHHTIETRLPDSLTTWVTHAFSLSTKYGLALAKPAFIQTSKDFIIDIKLPYSVRRGEKLQIPFTVHSYMNICAEVVVKLKVTHENQFVSTRNSKHTTRFCVGYDTGSVTDVSTLAISNTGDVNVSAQAQAFADRGCCLGKPKYQDRVRRLVGHDHVVKSFISEPEGVTKHYTHSVFLCPNERIHITTPEKNEFQFLKKPDRLTVLTIDVRAKQSFQIALSMEPEMNTDLIKIIIGGSNNFETWISKGTSGDKLSSVETPGILSWDEYKTFWITWQDGVIQIGKGSQPVNGSEVLSYHISSPIVVKYVGFSTDVTSVGNVQLWKKETTGMYGEVFHLGVPTSVIADSTRARVKAIGDILGPTTYNLERLVRLPSGCGEQNLVRFAPAVSVLRYLKRTDSLKPDVKEQAETLITQGYQRQLTYRRDDGSYSAFGDNDKYGSMWLTAFVLKSYGQARSLIFIDPEEIAITRQWIVKQQRKDGSFPRKGRLINKDLQGGLRGKISLTAYVVTALLEAGAESDTDMEVVRRASRFLEDKSHVISDAYTASLTAYALSLVDSSYALSSLRMLNHMKIIKDGMSYWKVTGRSLQEEVIMGLGNSWKRAVSSAEVEVASYALLTYVLRRDMSSALPVVKWLSLQRNDLGGFASTHDTCIGLDALSKYAAVVSGRETALTITMATTNLDFQEKFFLNEDSRYILQTAVIPTIPTALFVSAVGDGCALLQIDVQYNVPDESEEPSFKLDVQVSKANPIPEIFEDSNSTESVGIFIPETVTLDVCARWMHAGSSNMAVIDVTLSSGLHPDVTSLERMLQDERLKLKRYDVENGHIFFYFDEIPNGCVTCVRFQAYHEFVIGSVQNAPVTVYDYYEPAYQSTVFYNVSMLTDINCEGGKCEDTMMKMKGPGQTVVEKCSCYRDCGRVIDEVCASDGIIYDNLCKMEVRACQRDIYLDVMPMEVCLKVAKTIPLEGSGDVGSGDEPSLFAGVVNTQEQGDRSTGDDLVYYTDDKMSATEPEGYDYDYYYYDPFADEPGNDPIIEEDENVDAQTLLPEHVENMTTAHAPMETTGQLNIFEESDENSKIGELPKPDIIQPYGDKTEDGSVQENVDYSSDIYSYLLGKNTDQLSSTEKYP